MGKTGRNSLTRQLYKCDPRKVDQKTAYQAKRILNSFSLQAVQELSAGLALFYLFVSFRHNPLCWLLSATVRFELGTKQFAELANITFFGV